MIGQEVRKERIGLLHLDNKNSVRITQYIYMPVPDHYYCLIKFISISDMLFLYVDGNYVSRLVLIVLIHGIIAIVGSVIVLIMLVTIWCQCRRTHRMHKRESTCLLNFH